MYPMKQCAAKSKRSGKRCQNWAMRGKNTCRFHGGNSSGPKTKEGLENIKFTNTKHGFYSSATRSELNFFRETLHAIRAETAKNYYLAPCSRSQGTNS